MTINTKRGKISASKRTFNEISMLAHMASKKYADMGLDALAARAQEFSTEIYEVLDASGYYDDVKEK